MIDDTAPSASCRARAVIIIRCANEILLPVWLKYFPKPRRRASSRDSRSRRRRPCRWNPRHRLYTRTRTWPDGTNNSKTILSEGVRGVNIYRYSSTRTVCSGWARQPTFTLKVSSNQSYLHFTNTVYIIHTDDHQYLTFNFRANEKNKLFLH